MTVLDDAGAPLRARVTDAHPGNASLVTIIIPVYNRLQFLDQAIRSALDQTHGIVQVIVVDDGSSIDPLPVVSQYGGQVELLRKQNGGLASARNLGIAYARGEYVLFLDDDDYLEPVAVEFLLKAIESNPGTVWAAGGFAWVDEDGHKVPGKQCLHFESGDIYERMIFNCLMSCPSSVMVRTDLIRALGPFDEEFLLSEDYDMWLTLARDYPIAATQVLVTNYRIHARQISRTQWARHYEYHLRVLRKHQPRAHAGFEPVLERTIADVHFRYGDSLYVSGDHAAAREHWRRSLAAEGGPGRRRVLARFAKSYLPGPVLSILRTLAAVGRASLRGPRSKFPMCNPALKPDIPGRAGRCSAVLANPEIGVTNGVIDLVLIHRVYPQIRML